MKAVFGGAVKKPLMTKVSMRHLNEIVRERNQYSRDALEAWQDFINLKGRMDTELGKVTKRNNFLVEELESWKQQVSLVSSRVKVPHANKYSSSNSRLLLSNSLRRHKISRSRLRTTSVRTDVLLVSLTNRRMMRLAFQPAFLVPRSNVMMLLKRWSFNKRLLRSLSVSGNATRRSCLPYSTPT
jgi:LysM repeat protein